MKVKKKKRIMLFVWKKAQPLMIAVRIFLVPLFHTRDKRLNPISFLPLFFLSLSLPLSISLHSKELFFAYESESHPQITKGHRERMNARKREWEGERLRERERGKKRKKRNSRSSNFSLLPFPFMGLFSKNLSTHTQQTPTPPTRPIHRCICVTSSWH